MKKAIRTKVSRRTFATVAGTAAIGFLSSGHGVAVDQSSGTSTNSTDKTSNPDPRFPAKLEICSPFGFRLGTLVDEKGGKRQVLIPGTEDDYRKAEARRTGQKPTDVIVKKPVEEKGGLVLNYDSCALGHSGFCIGGCTDGGCRLFVDGDYFYCACVKS